MKPNGQLKITMELLEYTPNGSGTGITVEKKRAIKERRLKNRRICDGMFELLECESMFGSPGKGF
jgi:hypothetical protein